MSEAEKNRVKPGSTMTIQTLNSGSMKITIEDSSTPDGVKTKTKIILPADHLFVVSPADKDAMRFLIARKEIEAVKGSDRNKIPHPKKATAEETKALSDDDFEFLKAKADMMIRDHFSRDAEKGRPLTGKADAIQRNTFVVLLAYFIAGKQSVRGTDVFSKLDGHVKEAATRRFLEKYDDDHFFDDEVKSQKISSAFTNLLKSKRSGGRSAGCFVRPKNLKPGYFGLHLDKKSPNYTSAFKKDLKAAIEDYRNIVKFNSFRKEKP